MLVHEADLLGQAFGILRRTAETAMRHGFEDMQLGDDPGPAQRPVQDHGVRQEQVARARDQDRRREALAEIAEDRELRGSNVHMESREPSDPFAFDYLLKPVTPEALDRAISKLERNRGADPAQYRDMLDRLTAALSRQGHRYPSRIPSRLGDRVQFVDSLRAVLPTGGRYHMLCFSDRQPGDWGPRRVTQDEIRASFGDGWQVDSIDAAKIDINIDPKGALAWRSSINRT